MLLQRYNKIGKTVEVGDSFILQTREDLARGAQWLADKEPVFAELLCSLDINDERVVPLRLRKPDFASLTEIIIGQQVSTTSAASVSARLKDLVQPMEPQAFLDAGQEAWREAGLTRPKQAGIADLAGHLVRGELDLESLGELGSDEAKARLEAVRGIGPWTSEMFLLACIGHSDAFPAGDIAVQEAARWHFALDVRPDPKTLAKLAEGWRPLRAIATRLLWADYGRKRSGTGAFPGNQ